MLPAWTRRSRRVCDVAAEMGVSRACASKWVNRWRRHGDAGLLDQSSPPHRSPNATAAWVIEKIEVWRREHKWSARRITDIGFKTNRRTVTRHLTRLGLDERKFLDPGGDSNRKTGKITRPLARAHGAPGREEEGLVRCPRHRPNPPDRHLPLSRDRGRRHHGSGMASPTSSPHTAGPPLVRLSGIQGVGCVLEVGVAAEVGSGWRGPSRTDLHTGFGFRGGSGRAFLSPVGGLGRPCCSRLLLRRT